MCANHAGIRISWGDLRAGRLPHTNSAGAAEGGTRRLWKFQTFPERRGHATLAQCHFGRVVFVAGGRFSKLLPVVSLVEESWAGSKSVP